MKDDTSSFVFSRWLGPAKIVEIKSTYSYASNIARNSIIYMQTNDYMIG